eukprot:726492-Pelagomonas_calceolata.AAC.1
MPCLDSCPLHRAITQPPIPALGWKMQASSDERVRAVSAVFSQKEAQLKRKIMLAMVASGNEAHAALLNTSGAV